jgi:hypothetical protein
MSDRDFEGANALHYRMDALAKYVNDSEPEEEDDCTISKAIDKTNEQGVRVAGVVASLGDMEMAILIHNTPSPASELISNAEVLSEAKKAELLAHQAFALLAVTGGEGYLPVERTIFMYKMAGAMAEQGALGVGLPDIFHVFPCDFLSNFFSHQVEEGEDPLWESLRVMGDPFEMLADIHLIDIDEGTYLATCGFAHCGLPDLIWECENEKGASEMAETFRDIFHYMMENGPVIKAGDTVGFDDEGACRFSAPPEGFQLPYPSDEVLFVEV